MSCVGMGDAVLRDRLPTLWRRIEDAHYSYLETDDSPEKLQQKKKLEGGWLWSLFSTGNESLLVKYEESRKIKSKKKHTMSYCYKWCLPDNPWVNWSVKKKDISSYRSGRPNWYHGHTLSHVDWWSSKAASFGLNTRQAFIANIPKVRWWKKKKYIFVRI